MMTHCDECGSDITVCGECVDLEWGTLSTERDALRAEVRELKRRIATARRILTPWRDARGESAEALEALAAPRKAKR